MRFTSTDSLGNVYYLVVKPKKIYLTNPSLVLLALSNICDDAARLTFMLEDILDSCQPNPTQAQHDAMVKAMLDTLHMKLKGKWSVL